MTHSESQFKLNLFGKIANIKDTYHFIWYVPTRDIWRGKTNDRRFIILRTFFRSLVTGGKVLSNGILYFDITLVYFFIFSIVHQI